MNDQVILSVAKKNGGLEVTTGGTGQDQLNALRGRPPVRQPERGPPV